MSILIHRNRTNPRFGSGGRRAPMLSALQALFSLVYRAVLRTGKLLAVAAEIIADARMQRAMMEAEIHLNQHRRATDSAHSSKASVTASHGRRNT
jgi:hypothetical protein